MGPVEGMVVMEELGRGIVLEPLAQALIAGGVLAGYAARRGQGRLVAAKSPAAKRWWCWPSRSAPRATGSTLRRHATASGGALDGLDGTKSVVPAGDQADAFMVPAKVDGKMALFLVERAGRRGRRHAATARRTAAVPPKWCSTTPPPP